MKAVVISIPQDLSRQKFRLIPAVETSIAAPSGSSQSLCLGQSGDTLRVSSLALLIAKKTTVKEGFFFLRLQITASTCRILFEGKKVWCRND